MTTTDWFSKQKRAEEALAKALRRREEADFAYRQAEAELERVKAERRAAGVR